MYNKSRFLRTVSIVVTLLFAFNSIAMAAPGAMHKGSSLRAISSAGADGGQVRGAIGNELREPGIKTEPGTSGSRGKSSSGGIAAAARRLRNHIRRFLHLRVLSDPRDVIKLGAYKGDYLEVASWVVKGSDEETAFREKHKSHNIRQLDVFASSVGMIRYMADHIEALAEQRVRLDGNGYASYLRQVREGVREEYLRLQQVHFKVDEMVVDGVTIPHERIRPDKVSRLDESERIGLLRGKTDEFSGSPQFSATIDFFDEWFSAHGTIDVEDSEFPTTINPIVNAYKQREVTPIRIIELKDTHRTVYVSEVKLIEPVYALVLLVPTVIGGKKVLAKYFIHPTIKFCEGVNEKGRFNTPGNKHSWSNAHTGGSSRTTLRGRWNFEDTNLLTEFSLIDWGPWTRGRARIRRIRKAVELDTAAGAIKMTSAGMTADEHKAMLREYVEKSNSPIFTDEFDGSSAVRAPGMLPIAESIIDEIYADKNRLLADILESARQAMAGDLPLHAQEISTFLGLLETGKEFPRDNIVYQALVWIMRALPKTDNHCHLSTSIDRAWAIDQFIEMRSTRSMPHVEDYKTGTVSYEIVRALWSHGDEASLRAAIVDVYDRYDKGELTGKSASFDIPFDVAQRNEKLQVHLSMVSSVVRQYFQDGVFEVELLINPHKHTSYMELEEYLDSLHKALLELEQEADAQFGKGHRVIIRCCFNQYNIEREMQRARLMQTVRKICAIKKTNEAPYAWRLQGLDIAGKEQSGYERSKWSEDITRPAREAGLMISTHVGDTTHTGDRFKTNMIAHLAYLGNALSIKGLDRISHGRVLSKSDPRIRQNRGAIEAHIDGNVQFLAEKAIGVECTPIGAYKDMATLRAHPLYEWKAEGVELRFGIDGTSYMPSTLSQWLVQVLLASPNQDNPGHITFADIEKVSQATTDDVEPIVKSASAAKGNAAVSIGGHKIAVNIVDSEANLLLEESVNIKWREILGISPDTEGFYDNADRFMDQVIELIQQAITSADLEISSIGQIGISFAGPIDSETGVAGPESKFAAPNTPFDNYYIVSELQSRVAKVLGRENMPVQLVNDCRAAWLGERSPKGSLYDKATGKPLPGFVVIVGGGINFDANDPRVDEMGHHLALTRIVPSQYTKSKGAFTFISLEATEGKHPKGADGNDLKGDFEDLYSGPNIAKNIAGAFIFGGKPIESLNPDLQGIRRLIWQKCQNQKASLKGANGALHLASLLNLLVANKKLNKDQERRRSIVIDIVLRTITEAAKEDNAAAKLYIVGVATGIGQALAAFIDTFKDEEFIKRGVLVSGVNENLGKGVLDTEGQDLYLASIRSAIVVELTEKYGMAKDRAEALANGIIRSELTFEREIIAFAPEKSASAGNALATGMLLALIADSLEPEGIAEDDLDTTKMKKTLLEIGKRLSEYVDKTLVHVLQNGTLPTPEALDAIPLPVPKAKVAAHIEISDTLDANLRREAIRAVEYAAQEENAEHFAPYQALISDEARRAALASDGAGVYRLAWDIKNKLYGPGQGIINLSRFVEFVFAKASSAGSTIDIVVTNKKDGMKLRELVNQVLGWRSLELGQLSEFSIAGDGVSIQSDLTSSAFDRSLALEAKVTIKGKIKASSAGLVEVRDVEIGTADLGLLRSADNESKSRVLDKIFAWEFHAREFDETDITSAAMAPGRDPRGPSEHDDYPDQAADVYAIGCATADNYMTKVGLRTDGKIRMLHAIAQQAIEFDIKNIKKLQVLAKQERDDRVPEDQRQIPLWAVHGLAVLIRAQEDHGADLQQGMDIILSSSIPHGAGLSNSAANCGSVGMVINDLCDLGLDKFQIALLAQAAEHDDFVGGECGLLDQLLSIFGEPGKLTLINFRKPLGPDSIQSVDFDLPDTIQRVSINTNFPRSLPDTEYNDRKAELILIHSILSDILGYEVSSTSLTLGDLNHLIFQLTRNRELMLSPEQAGFVGEMQISDLPAATGLDLTEDQLAQLQRATDASVRLAGDKVDAILRYVSETYKKPELGEATTRHKDIPPTDSFVLLLRRMRHQLTDPLRIMLFAKACKENDMETAFRLVTAAGNSLKIHEEREPASVGDFQITGRNGAQDALLRIALETAAEIGIKVAGRMSGGGGGGFDGFYADRTDEGKYQKWLRLIVERYNAWAAQHPRASEVSEPIVATVREEGPPAEGATMMKLKAASAGENLHLALDMSTQSVTFYVIDMETKELLYEHQEKFDDPYYEDFGSPKGHIVAMEEEDPTVFHANPLMWAVALDRGMSELQKKVGDKMANIKTVAGAGQQHGTVYLNKKAVEALQNLDPERPLEEQLKEIFSRKTAPIWEDKSTGKQAAKLQKKLGGAEATANRTGSKAELRFSGPQIMKFYDECQESGSSAWDDTYAILNVAAFLGALMSGQARFPWDFSDGAGTNIMDIRAQEWIPEIDELAPGARDKLTELKPSNEIISDVSPYWSRYGMPEDTKVVNMVGDNPSGLTGQGIVRPGSISISLGTSFTLYTYLKRGQLNKALERIIGHVFMEPTGNYMKLVCFQNGALSLEKTRDRYITKKEATEIFRQRHGRLPRRKDKDDDKEISAIRWEIFEKLVGECPPANNGAMMITQHTQEEAVRIPYERGKRFARNITDFRKSNRAQVLRAAAEGQIYFLKWIADQIGLDVREISLIGGSSKNAAIRQMIADIFDADVRILKEGREAVPMGSAIRGAKAYHDATHQKKLSWSKAVEGLTEYEEEVTKPKKRNVKKYGARLGEFGSMVEDAMATVEVETRIEGEALSEDFVQGEISAILDAQAIDIGEQGQISLSVEGQEIATFSVSEGEWREIPNTDPDLSWNGLLNNALLGTDSTDEARWDISATSDSKAGSIAVTKSSSSGKTLAQDLPYDYMLIKNGRVVTPGGIKNNTCILVKDGAIQQIGPLSDMPVMSNETVKIVDAKGSIVGPGFVDIHVHGAADVQPVDGEVSSVIKMAEVLQRHGTTLFIPTAVALPVSKIYTFLDAIRQAQIQMSGIGPGHIEGPWISLAKKGAQPAEYIFMPDETEIRGFIRKILDEEYPLATLTVAPETFAERGVEHLLQEMHDAGINLAVGHSDMNEAQVTGGQVLSSEVGALSMVTHAYNRIAKKEFLIKRLLELDLIYTIILDLVHIPLDGDAGVRRILDAGKRVAFITDSLNVDGQSVQMSGRLFERMIDNRPERGPGEAFYSRPQGEETELLLGGSVASMDMVFRNAVGPLGLSIEEAFFHASTQPALAEGLKGKGALEVGKDADVVILDGDHKVLHTIIEGEVAYSNDSESISIQQPEQLKSSSSGKNTDIRQLMARLEGEDTGDAASAAFDIARLGPDGAKAVDLLIEKMLGNPFVFKNGNEYALEQIGQPAIPALERAQSTATGDWPAAIGRIIENIEAKATSPGSVTALDANVHIVATGLVDSPFTADAREIDQYIDALLTEYPDVCVELMSTGNTEVVIAILERMSMPGVITPLPLEAVGNILKRAQGSPRTKPMAEAIDKMVRDIGYARFTPIELPTELEELRSAEDGTITPGITSFRRAQKSEVFSQTRHLSAEEWDIAVDTIRGKGSLQTAGRPRTSILEQHGNVRQYFMVEEGGLVILAGPADMSAPLKAYLLRKGDIAVVEPNTFHIGIARTKDTVFVVFNEDLRRLGRATPADTTITCIGNMLEVKQLETKSSSSGVKDVAIYGLIAPNKSGASESVSAIAKVNDMRLGAEIAFRASRDATLNIVQQAVRAVRDTGNTQLAVGTVLSRQQAIDAINRVADTAKTLGINAPALEIVTPGITLSSEDVEAIRALSRERGVAIEIAMGVGAKHEVSHARKLGADTMKAFPFNLKLDKEAVTGDQIRAALERATLEEKAAALKAALNGPMPAEHKPVLADMVEIVEAEAGLPYATYTSVLEFARTDPSVPAKFNMPPTGVELVDIIKQGAPDVPVLITGGVTLAMVEGGLLRELDVKAALSVDQPKIDRLSELVKHTPLLPRYRVFPKSASSGTTIINIDSIDVRVDMEELERLYTEGGYALGSELRAIAQSILGDPDFIGIENRSIKAASIDNIIPAVAVCNNDDGSKYIILWSKDNTTSCPQAIVLHKTDIACSILGLIMGTSLGMAEALFDEIVGRARNVPEAEEARIATEETQDLAAHLSDILRQWEANPVTAEEEAAVKVTSAGVEYYTGLSVIRDGQRDILGVLPGFLNHLGSQGVNIGGVEMHMREDGLDQHLNEYLSSLDRGNVKIVTIAPEIWDPKLFEDLTGEGTLSSDNPERRQRAIGMIKQAIDMVNQLNQRYHGDYCKVNLWPGLDQIDDDGDVENYAAVLKRFADSLKECLEYASEKGITISIEQIPASSVARGKRPLIRQTKDVVELKEIIEEGKGDAANLGAVLDIAHELKTDLNLRGAAEVLHNAKIPFWIHANDEDGSNVASKHPQLTRGLFKFLAEIGYAEPISLDLATTETGLHEAIDRSAENMTIVDGILHATVKPNVVSLGVGQHEKAGRVWRDNEGVATLTYDVTRTGDSFTVTDNNVDSYKRLFSSGGSGLISLDLAAADKKQISDTAGAALGEGYDTARVSISLRVDYNRFGALRMIPVITNIEDLAKATSPGTVEELNALREQLHITEENMVNSIINAIIPSQFVTDVGESGGRPTQAVISELSEYLMLSGIMLAYASDKKALTLSAEQHLSGSYTISELVGLIQAIASQQNASEARMSTVFFNCIDPTRFMEQLATYHNLGAPAEETTKPIRERFIDIANTVSEYPVVALLGTSYIIANLDEVATGVMVDLFVTDIMDTESMTEYAKGILDIEATLPEGFKVDQGKFKAVMKHLKAVAAASADREYSYKGDVVAYYDRFRTTEAAAYEEFITTNYANGRDDIKYLISSGIGANEMYSHALAAYHNTFDGRKTEWIVINNPSDLRALPADANADNTVFMEYSRSGDTQETVKILQFSHERFPKRIVYSNKGPLRKAAEALAEREGYAILVREMAQNIGGRLMRRVTPLAFGPMYLAGMDTETYAAHSNQFAKELDFKRGRKSLAIGLARLLFVSIVLGDRHDLALMYNNPKFLSHSAREIRQLWLEGANKKEAYKLILGMHELPRGAHESIEAVLAQHQSMIAFGIISRHSGFDEDNIKLRQEDLVGVDADDAQQHAGLTLDEIAEVFSASTLRTCQKVMPVIGITLDKPDLVVNAALSTLFEDLAVAYCDITGQDPNSNQEVKAVREGIAIALQEKVAAMQPEVKSTSSGSYGGTDGRGHHIVHTRGGRQTIGSAQDLARAARSAGLSVGGTDGYGHPIINGRGVDHTSTRAIEDAFKSRSAGKLVERTDLLESIRAVTVKLDANKLIAINPLDRSGNVRFDIASVYDKDSPELAELQRELGDCTIRLTTQLTEDDVRGKEVVLISDTEIALPYEEVADQSGKINGKIKRIGIPGDAVTEEEHPLAFIICVATQLFGNNTLAGLDNALNRRLQGSAIFAKLFGQQVSREAIERFLATGFFELPVPTVDYKEIRDIQKSALLAAIAA